MAKESQIHLLIVIISKHKLNDIICFNLSGSNDATVASCCVYLLVKGDWQYVFEHLSLFTCSRDGECIVRLFLAAFTDGGVQQLAKFNVNRDTRKCISCFKTIPLYKHLSCSDLLLRLFFSVAEMKHWSFKRMETVKKVLQGPYWDKIMLLLWNGKLITDWSLFQIKQR